ncbi:MAG: hypothetical protein ACM3ZT_02535 [Bacillota bacterium]
MLKFLKQTPVHITCPHCGKIQHPRLKWASHHKSLKCRNCKKNIDLREKPVQRLIGQTAAALSVFQQALDHLQAVAKKTGRALKGRKKAEKKKKKEAKKDKKKAKKAKAHKKTAKRAPKKAASSAAPKPAVAVSAAPGATQPDE